MNQNWYLIADIDQLDSPALIVFLERVKANIETAISMVDSVDRLRPHVKTNKSAEATRLMLDAGITKFKCATIAEAEMLGTIGAPDVVLAYQPLGPKLQRFIELIKKFPATKYACLTDNISAAKEQANAFGENGIEVPVYIDLNIGMNRTGIIPNENAIELCKFCSTTRGIKFAGSHAYDGHLRNADINIRTKECDEAFAQVEKLKQQLLKAGLTVPNIIAGGSPTFPIHAKRKNVECSPGTFIYWDKGYSDQCAEQNFLPAAVLVTRIISLPSATRICTDLGHKSVAAENEIGKRVFFLNAPDLVPVSQSEEHLVCEVEANHNHKTGDILYGIPYHICPTVALYERVQVIEGRTITGEWKNIARDRKLTV
ncbi:MAG TPA: D-TA family PLP-dependent enzyme [Chitinophagaceae bacterium]|jgi:D-serine deaminase-like pyridoxal phosphate-dependent protein|nr:D-TA family PLP-dependent enzyme [Chitinophagaceae bacterium]